MTTVGAVVVVRLNGRLTPADSESEQETTAGWEADDAAADGGELNRRTCILLIENH